MRNSRMENNTRLEIGLT